MEGFELLILAAIFLVAVLYSSVGHGGGSGYLAVMAFFAIAPNVTKPTALALNIFVSSIATIQFYRRGPIDLMPVSFETIIGLCLNIGVTERATNKRGSKCRFRFSSA